MKPINFLSLIEVIEKKINSNFNWQLTKFKENTFLLKAKLFSFKGQSVRPSIRNGKYNNRMNLT